MKAGWWRAELQTLTTTFADGDWIETKDQSDSGIRLIQTGNVGDGVFKDRAEKARFINEETFKRIRCTEIHAGDCLISRLPDPVGRACIIPETGERMITAVDCTILRFDRSTVLPEFFVYFAQSRDYLSEIAALSTGTTRLRISRANLGKVTIPLPPLDEQNRIVTVLDEALEGLSRARANAEANLADARELFESTLRGVFHGVEQTAPKHTLAAVSKTFGRGKSRHRPRNDPKLYGGNFPFVQTGEIRNSDGFVTAFSQTYNEVGLAQSKLWPEGTVCITIAANIAETAILGFPACFPDSIIGMVCDPERTRPEYVELMLRYFAADLKEKGKGSAQDNINLATFEQSLFPIPSVTEQVRIVDKLSEVAQERRNLESHFMEVIASLDTLRQSLLQKAFSGELR